MKIDGMDASQTTYLKAQDSKPANDNSETNTNDNVNQNIYNLKISQLTPVEKKELPVSEKVVIDAIEKANKAISGGMRRFEFSIHPKTKEIMVKVINSDTNEIVREIPPEKTLDMVAKFWEMAGIMVDERR
ncbi:MAG: flagellar protein FlaG [Bacillota bacterium]|nr:flagellar protein FlaG [Bacillota bacterium]